MKKLNTVSGQILDAAIEVHRNLGPGLLESVYEVCLEKELLERGLSVERQINLPVYYKGTKLDTSFRLDMLVENDIIIELKTVEKTLPVHEAQILSYMKLANKKLGLLINFNEALLKNGFHRFKIEKWTLQTGQLLSVNSV